MLLLEQCIRIRKRSMSYPLHTVIINVLLNCIMDADNGQNHTAKNFLISGSAQYHIIHKVQSRRSVRTDQENY